MLRTALSCFVSFLHFLVLFWALVAPFHKELQVSYVVLMPIIVLHWILLDDSCILTVLEKHIRGVFWGRVLCPQVRVKDIQRP